MWGPWGEGWLSHSLSWPEGLCYVRASAYVRVWVCVGVCRLHTTQQGYQRDWAAS